MSDPILSTLFLCERMIRDDLTKTWGALGLGHVLRAHEVPFNLHEAWFFLRIADAPDRIALRGAFVSPSGLVVAVRDWSFTQEQTTQGMPLPGWWEIGGRFTDVTIAEKGRYSVEMAVNGRTVGETPLFVV